MAKMGIVVVDKHDLSGEHGKKFDGDDTIRLVSSDGRPLFEILMNDDGVSFEVRALSAVKIGECRYSSTLLLRPRASNSVEIGLDLY